MTLDAGTRLGSYDLQARLGEGGMGEVWKAYDPKLQRTVAIKVLKRSSDSGLQSSVEPEAAGRILAEARAASALNHPHICTIYDVGEAVPSTPSAGSEQAGSGQAVSFIVMEHVEGKPLSELIPSDGLSPESVIRYGTQVAEALAHAHERGIVHRDLKSANVVITPEAQVKLIDFGIAVPLPDIDADAVTRTMESPVSSAPVGTLAYMAPEVLAGAEATARSDIWSLGVLLYEMASGRLPFEGETGAEVAANILKESPESLPDRVTANLRSIVERCLSKEPGRRYGNGGLGHAALEAIQSGSSELQAATTRAWDMRWKVVAVAIAWAVLGGVSAYWLRMSGDAPARQVARLVNPRQVTSAIGVEDRLTWSPDGQRIAYESEQSGNWDIWVAQIGGQPPVNLTADHEGPDQRPSWSPDGTRIAFVSDRGGHGYFTMSGLGGPPQKVMTTTNTFPHRPQWSADGTDLAGMVVADDGNAAIEIVTLESRASHRVDLPGAQFAYDLSWSPRGRWFAVVDTASYGAEAGRLWMVSRSTGESIPLTDGRAQVWSPSWSPDERSLYYVSNRTGSLDLWQQALAPDGAPDGPPQAVTTGIGLRSAAMSPDGARLAYSRGSRVGNVWRVPILPGREATWEDAEQVTFDQAVIQYIDFSADGERLFVSSDRMGNQDLWELPAGGGTMRQLTTEPTPDWTPRISPDGETVAFYSYRSGNRDLWIMPTMGGPARQLTRHDGVDAMPTWSPDGGEIAYASDRAGNWDIWVLSLTGGEPRQVTTDSATDGLPVWSPDGEWIGFNSSRSGTFSGWRVPAAGGVAEPLTTEPALFADWSSDSRTAYVSRPDGLWSVSVDGGGERRLANLAGRHGNLLTDSPAVGYSENGYLYFTWQEDLGDIWVMDVEWDD